MTNFEWLKTLNAEEMSEFLEVFQERWRHNVCYTISFKDCEDNGNNCSLCILKWLNEEHKDDGETKGLSEGADS